MHSLSTWNNGEEWDFFLMMFAFTVINWSDLIIVYIVYQHYTRVKRKNNLLVVASWYCEGHGEMYVFREARRMGHINFGGSEKRRHRQIFVSSQVKLWQRWAICLEQMLKKLFIESSLRCIDIIFLTLLMIVLNVKQQKYRFLSVQYRCWAF